MPEEDLPINAYISAGLQMKTSNTLVNTALKQFENTSNEVFKKIGILSYNQNYFEKRIIFLGSK
jgi:hypothetical protein